MRPPSLTRSIRSSLRFAPWALASAVVLAACGDSNGDGNNGPGPLTLVALPLQNGSCLVGQPLGEPLRVRVDNADGGTEPGITVQFQVSLGNGQLSASSAVSGSDGVAETGFTCGSTAGVGANRVTTSIDGSSAEWTIDGSAGPPPPAAGLRLYLNQGSQTFSDSALALTGFSQLVRPVGVAVDDAGQGLPVGTLVNWSLAGGGSLSSAQTSVIQSGSGGPAGCSAPESGVATCFVNDWTLGSTAAPGVQTVTATLASNPAATDVVHVRIVQGPFGITGNGFRADTLPVQSQGREITIRLVDGAGQPIRRALYRLRWQGSCAGAITLVSSGQAFGCAGADVYTDADGTASARLNIGSATGTFRLVWALNTFMATGSYTHEFTVTPDAPAALSRLAGDGQAGTVNQPLATPLTVKVVDQFNNPVPAITVHWAIATGGGALSAATSTTGTNGQATIGWTLGAAAGQQSVSATVGTLNTTFTATAFGGTPPPPEAPGRPLFVVQAAETYLDSVLVYTGFSQVIRPMGAWKDAFGNPVPVGTAIRWSVSGGGSLASAQSTVQQANVGGPDGCYPPESGFDTCFVNSWTVGPTAVPGMQTVTATAVNDSTLFGRAHLRVLKGPFQITANAPDTQSIAPRGTQRFSVRIVDGNGQPISRALFRVRPHGACGGVFLAVSDGAGYGCGGANVFTDDNGTATLDFVADTVAGTYEFNWSLNSINGGASRQYVAITGGAPATLQKTGGDGQAGTAGFPLGLPLRVKVLDGFNNPVAGLTVQWTVASGGGIIGAASSVTNASGEATVTWTLGPTIGAQTVKATVGALSITFSAVASP